MLRTFEFDDWPRGKQAAWPLLVRLREALPGFKATLFAIPSEMSERDWREIELFNTATSGGNWLRVAPHGFKHIKGECRMRRRYRRQAGLLADIASDQRWTKLFKAPWYGYDAGCIQLLHSHGFAIAVRTLAGFPFPCEPDVRIWSLDDCYGNPHARWLVHPIYVPRRPRSAETQLDDAMVDRIIQSSTASDTWGWPDEMTRPALLKVNIGCGTQISPSWACLDHQPEKQPPGAVIGWQWPEPLPFAANMADIAHHSHLLYYIAEEDYPKFFLDIWRILRPGGILRMGEDNTRRRVWHRIGCRHVTGKILSHPTPQSVRLALELVGFEVHESTPDTTLSHHADVLAFSNRSKYYRKGAKFYFEAVKRIDIPDLSRAWRHDLRMVSPMSQREDRGRYVLPSQPPVV